MIDSGSDMLLFAGIACWMVTAISLTRVGWRGPLPTRSFLFHTYFLILGSLMTAIGDDHWYFDSLLAIALIIHGVSLWQIDRSKPQSDKPPKDKIIVSGHSPGFNDEAIGPYLEG
jgi:hypothetical protein